MAFTNGWLPQMPALFTRRSVLPKCSMVVAIRSRPPSGVETSLSFAIASPPRDRMRSATSSAIVESFPNPDTLVPRSFTTTRALRSARSSAYARPSPRPAPVTTATFPSNEIRSLISLSSSRKPQNVGTRATVRLAPRETIEAGFELPDRSACRWQQSRHEPIGLSLRSGATTPSHRLPTTIDEPSRFRKDGHVSPGEHPHRLCHLQTALELACRPHGALWHNGSNTLC